LVAHTLLPSTQAWHESGAGGHPVGEPAADDEVHCIGLHTGAPTPQAPASQVAV
jgi:hypothetical protein